MRYDSCVRLIIIPSFSFPCPSMTLHSRVDHFPMNLNTKLQSLSKQTQAVLRASYDALDGHTLRLETISSGEIHVIISDIVRRFCRQLILSDRTQFAAHFFFQTKRWFAIDTCMILAFLRRRRHCVTGILPSFTSWRPRAPVTSSMQTASETFVESTKTEEENRFFDRMS